MFNARAFLGTFRWPPALAALAATTLGYFAASRFLQDRVLPVDRWAVAHKLSTFEVLPEPWEMPLFLAGYLAIPLIALVLYYPISSAFTRVRRWPRPSVRLRLGMLAAVAVLAVALGWRFSPLISERAAFVAGYLERVGVWHALWLLTTKRLYAVRLALGVSVAVFLFLSWRWRQASFHWLKRHADPRWIARLEPWLLVLLAVIIFDPSFPYEQRHANHVIGTVNDVLAGKPFLYETTNQYGILNTYALVALFKIVPLSYQALSLVLSVSYFFFFAFSYALLKRWLHSRLLALLGTATAVGTYFLLQAGPFLSSVHYPGTTPYRQGWYVLVAAAVLFVSRRPQLPWWRRDLPLQLAAVAAVWNLDSGLAIAAATVVAAAAIQLSSLSPKVLLRRLLATGLRQAAYLALGFSAVAVGNFWYYGAWPNFSLYRDAMAVYRTGISKLPMPAVGMFEWYVLTYLAAGVLVLRRWAVGRKVDATFLFLLTYGALSVTYYVGNSAWSYLYPISTPLVFVLLYLVSDLYLFAAYTRGPHEPLAARAFVALAAFVALIVAAKLPVLFSTRNYRDITQRLRPQASADTPELLADAERIAAEFLPGSRPPLVHANDGQLLLLSRRTNWFPIYDQLDVVFDWNLQRLTDQVRRERPEYLLIGNEDFPYRPYFMAAIDGQYAPAESWATLQIYRPVRAPGRD
ncbi:MAG: hypothetical protein Q7S23_01385 [bacterium]|nr:hypothetical protein [bacterium]